MILITGATGFLGSYLLRQLLRTNENELLALKRKDSPMDLVADIAGQVRWVEGDILDILRMDEVMQGVKKVYHCAAMVSHDSKDIWRMKQVNVEGTANVVNAALVAGVERFLHVSSIAAIGRTKPQQHIDENSKWSRSPYNSHYAISKYLAEQEAWRGQAEGLNVVVINPGIILGRTFWDKGTGRLFERVAEGLRFYPIGSSGFVDVRDVARMSVQIMESDLKKNRFIAVGENTSYQRVFSLIAKALGNSPPAYRASPWMGEVAWRMAWLWGKVSGKSPALTRETARLTACQFVYDPSKSIRELDFQYRPLEETIAWASEGFLKRNN